MFLPFLPEIVSLLTIMLKLSSSFIKAFLKNQLRYPQKGLRIECDYLLIEYDFEFDYIYFFIFLC